MSTLTSSPSPAASPRPSFSAHYTTSQRPTKSPRLLPFQSPGSRSRASVHTTAPSPRFSSRSSTHNPKTADAATQYTPEGFPPTASQTAGSKRKDLSPPSLQMNHLSTDDQRLPSHEIQSSPQAPQAAPTNPQSTAADSSTSDGAQPHNKVGHHSAPADPAMSPSVAKRPRTAEAPPSTSKMMPIRYETCNAKDLGFLISNMLMELIRLNDKLPLNGRLTRFHSRAPPGITCHDYLQRLIQHATLSPPILLSMVYYIDRLCALYPAFNVSSLTVHRFLITAATVASKGLSDSFWTNPTYARIGGITTGELATLEMEFLQKVEWRIVPKPEVLVDYYMSLVERSKGYELEQEQEHAASGTQRVGVDTQPP